MGEREPKPRTRALLLAALILLGIVVGIVGQRLTGDDAWFLAVPILMAVGWLFVADPEQCGRCQPPGE